MINPDLNIVKIVADLIVKDIVSSERDFAISIDMDPSNYYKIKRSDQNEKRSYHFTLDQIRKIGVKYNVDANFIFGLSKEMYRNK